MCTEEEARRLRLGVTPDVEMSTPAKQSPAARYALLPLRAVTPSEKKQRVVTPYNAGVTQPKRPPSDPNVTTVDARHMSNGQQPHLMHLPRKLLNAVDAIPKERLGNFRNDGRARLLAWTVDHWRNCPL